ncbi:MAG: rhomboid family intramembrane serine protease [Candidatus Eremiobacteraeota bacterium]|nr:rhomboid family intramembrane serine protease [Candidatus Eremiobacteraeota bacterium]
MTLSIIAVNVLVFVLELLNGEVAKWALIPADVAAGHNLYTLVTAMFLHGSWSHIIGNMVFFWAFGPEIEDEMGPWRYAIFYLLGGIVANLAQVAMDPHSTIPNLGASGAIAAVMGAFLVTFPQDQIRSLLVIGIFVRVAYVPAVLLVGGWFLLQLWSAGTVIETQAGGVAYVAHIGGFVFGCVFARLFASPSTRTSVW